MKCLRKERYNMIDMYVKLVQSGLRTIEQVPAKYLAQVKAVLGIV